MCGIFAYLSRFENQIVDLDIIKDTFERTKNRGLDHHELKSICFNLLFGFHRLSINDTSFKGNQPLFHPRKPYVLICNGEIYNYKELYKKNECIKHLIPFSNSDCEVILYLYENFGIEKTLQMIDSEAFAFCLYDGELNQLFVARDRFGVRPLFFGESKDQFVFCSELKGVQPLCQTIKQFHPACWMCIDMNQLSSIDIKYHLYYKHVYPIIEKKYNEKELCQQIYQKLEHAVEKRLLSDRPIGCLLSGGLDSSIISCLVGKAFRKQNRGQLHTFSIGLKGSPDLYYARKVANFIGSCHHHIECSEKQFLENIPKVIYHIESYDTTTVRASVGNYLVGKYIAEHTDIKVIFNGDGSDEQSGYLYLKNAPNENEFQQECIRLLQEIHYFDVLRSDRCLSSNFSLETRTPFLDTEFVNFYMSIPSELKMYSTDKIEKFLLRKAFENDLPGEVVWRKKEAFSDGCSSAENSWHHQIQKFVNKIISDDEFKLGKEKYKHNTPMLKESLYYRQIFESQYPHCENVIPHFWMPKWCYSKHDPSARELNNDS